MSGKVEKLEKAENDLILVKSLLKAQEAYSVLEENKKGWKTIPVHRLERILAVLKAFIDEFLSREG